MLLPSRSSKAFTLLELIVVIVILGILAAIAIPTFARVIEKSKKSSLDSTLSAVDRNARALAAFDSRTVTETDLRDAGAEAPNAGTYAYTATTVTLTKDGLCRQLTVVLNGAGTLGDCAAPVVATSPYVNAVLADAPTVYYRLGEASGTNLADSSGNGHAMALQGTGTLGVAGLAGDGTALGLAGTGWAQSAGGAHLNTATTTVEAWVKFAPKADYSTFVDRDLESATRQFQFRSTPNGLVEYIVFVGGVDQHVFSTTRVDDNLPHHVVGTYDGTTAKVYVDGVLQGSLNAPGTYSTGGTDQLNIGGHGINAELYRYNGTIDEVAVYGSALTAERIAAHHAAR